MHCGDFGTGKFLYSPYLSFSLHLSLEGEKDSFTYLTGYGKLLNSG